MYGEDLTVLFTIKVTFIQLQLTEQTHPTHVTSLQFVGKLQSSQVSKDQKFLTSFACTGNNLRIIFRFDLNIFISIDCTYTRHRHDTNFRIRTEA